MKLRIKGNSLRMRLTKSEIAQIQSGEGVKETVQFGPDSKLVYSLRPTRDAHEIRALLSSGNVEVEGPRELLVAWATGSEVSIKNHQANGGAEPLFILIEKDFFCLKPRVHEVEDESDMFDNPNHAHGSCG